VNSHRRNPLIDLCKVAPGFDVSNMSAPNVVFIERHTRNSRRFVDLEIDAQSIGKLLRTRLGFSGAAWPEEKKTVPAGSQQAWDSI
jgi:hypothetical protein